MSPNQLKATLIMLGWKLKTSGIMYKRPSFIMIISDNYAKYYKTGAAHAVTYSFIHLLDKITNDD